MARIGRSNFEKVNNVKVPFVIQPRRQGDISTMFADPKLAESELGWKAVHTLEEMCEDFWRWQTMNPGLIVEDYSLVAEATEKRPLDYGEDVSSEVCPNEPRRRPAETVARRRRGPVTGALCSTGAWR